MAWVSSGCGLISTKVPCSAPAAATAWLNRTGLRRLATQYSASKSGTTARVVGRADQRDPRRLRGQVGQRRPQLGQYRINGRVVGGHIHLDAPRQPVLRAHHRDHRIDPLGRPGDHGLARRGIHRQGDFGVVGDQRRGGFPGPTPAAPSRPARPAGPSTATGWRSPATPRPGSAPRPPPPRSPHPSNARSPHPGVTPWERHSSVNANCTPTSTGWIRSMPTTGSPRIQHLPQRKPHLLNKHRLQLGHRRGERRLIDQQLPAHPRPLRTLTRNTQTPCPAGTAPHADPPPPRRMPGGQRPQPGHRLRAITAHTPWRTSRAGPGDDSACAPPRPTPRPPRRRPSSRPAPPPSRPPAQRVLPETTNVVTAGSGSARQRDREPAPAPTPHAHWCH